MFQKKLERCIEIIPYQLKPWLSVALYATSTGKKVLESSKKLISRLDHWTDLRSVQ